MITYGFMALPDYEYPPTCVVIWGLNICTTAIGECRRVNEALEEGSKLIVIDPDETGYTPRADIWAQPL